tara:strand:- start:131 stop:343 length:213 start_codon:yes stop_codon:yes gene_type:complete
MDYLKNIADDFLKSLQSKRVIAATLTAFFVAMGNEMQTITPEQATTIAGIVIALIVGDSLRPVSNKKLEK